MKLNISDSKTMSFMALTAVINEIQNNPRLTVFKLKSDLNNFYVHWHLEQAYTDMQYVYDISNYKLQFRDVL